MENQTRFDLNAAVENWRHELAAQPNLAPDDQRELETHLRDAIAGFQQRGLNDEESFWLARKRVGQPQPLGDEFVKANPTAIWRERAFWVIFGLCVLPLWNLACHFLPVNFQPYYNCGNFNPNFDESWSSPLQYLPDKFVGMLLQNPYFIPLLQSLIYVLPIICLFIFLTKGRVNSVERVFRFVFRSRFLFALTASVFVLAFHFQNAWVVAMMEVYGYNSYFQYGIDVLIASIWPLTVIALIVWLMPPQNQKTPKRA